MKYRIPPFLRKKIPTYMKHFYSRVRRMKRNGYTYDVVESVISNLMIYTSHLQGEGKTKLAEKEMKLIEGILNKYAGVRKRRRGGDDHVKVG